MREGRWLGMGDDGALLRFGTASRLGEADWDLMLSFATFDFELFGFSILEAEAMKVEAFRLLPALLRDAGVIGRDFGRLAGCC